MKKIILSIAFLSSAIFLTACGAATAEHPSHHNHQEQTAAVNTGTNTSPDAAQAFRVDYKAEPTEIKTGQSAILSFTVKDASNNTIKDLQIVHEKPMHLLIVSSDLAEFYHVHPEQNSADGSFRVAHTFKYGGNYKLYADFTPQNASQIVEQIDIKVDGQERPKTELIADANFSKTVGGLRVEMKADKAIRSGQDLMLNFQAFDAASGKPATDLENYLGELAHFVIISQDLKDFVHAHPMSKEEHAAMNHAHNDSHSAPHSHQETVPAETKKAATASEIAAHVAFPRAGLYKIWAQFQRGGQVIDVPFVVNVAEGAPTTAAKTVDVPADAIKVTLSGEGYEPKAINVKQGQPAKLAFYRANGDNCGGEVLIPSQNIKKELPVGEIVLVEFTPTKAGELAFTCGMGMYKGKLLVAAK